MERGGGRYKTMERKNRKSGSTILYLNFTHVQQGTRRKSTPYSSSNHRQRNLKQHDTSKEDTEILQHHASFVIDQSRREYS